MHFHPIEPVIDAEPLPYLMALNAEPATDLDDVFEPETDHSAHHHSADHSDHHRIQTDHTTAGYREGLTIAKESSIQAGFDEGYGVGGAMGLEAGQLQGLLEGIVAALGSENAGPGLSADRKEGGGRKLAELNGLLKEATEDLSPARLFSPDYWEGDGNWKFEVNAQDGGPQERVTFLNVARAHPLIKRWHALVERIVDDCGINRSIFDDEKRFWPEKQHAEEGNHRADRTISTEGLESTRNPLDW